MPGVARNIKPTSRGSDIEKLNIKQRMFVEALLADPTFNLTEAAKVAGYKNPATQGGRVIKLRRVRAIVGKEIQNRITRNRLEADAVLAHLQTALFLDPLELFEQVGKNRFIVKDLKTVPEEIRRCITKLKTREETTVKGQTITTVEIELMSKDAAMSNALKHLGLVSPDTKEFNVNVQVDLKTLVAEVEEERKSIIDGTVINRLASQSDDEQK